jgi:mRNA interferase MazF
MPCSRNEVVLLPIPFTDLSSSKVRPAIVVGRGTWPGDPFVVPVTSQLGNADMALARWAEAGLNVPSGIKGQLCTIEDRLVRKVVGRISDQDRTALDAMLRQWLQLRVTNRRVPRPWRQLIRPPAP